MKIIISALLLAIISFTSYKIGRIRLMDEINKNHKSGVLFTSKFIPMPEYYKKITGCDSIQLFVGAKSNPEYNYNTNDFNVIWDSLQANFCHPNKLKAEDLKVDSAFIDYSGKTLIIENSVNGEQHNNTGSGTQTIYRR